jgi:hypothetical protein
MRAPIGRSLHIGINHVDPAHYGKAFPLAGCEFDAHDVQAIAEARGFDSSIILSTEATADRIIGEIAAAAEELRPGDIFLISYSGHGAQVPDLNGDDPEDERDETWVLFDRMLVDDELYALWGRFAQAVRIVVVSDSCHSGSVTRDVMFNFPMALPEDDGEHRFKMLPRDAEEATYAAHRTAYESIQASNPQGDRVGVGASVLLLSGCLDSQRSLDGDRNGLYTKTLRDVWADGSFHGGYRGFQAAIGTRMPPWQTPNFFTVGLVNRLFEAEDPFTI